MQRITNDQNPLPFLQQRIIYAQQHIHSPIYFVENVPARDDDFSSINIDVKPAFEYCSSQGLTKLIEIILSREFKRYQLDIDFQQVMITNGGLHALSLVFKMLRSFGKKVLCHSPVFSGVSALLIKNGYEIIYISEALTEAQIRRVLKQHEDANFVYINIPNNPTGKIYNRLYLDILMTFIQDNETKLIADLVYDDYVFTNMRDFNPLSWTSNWHNIFTINSLSKNWGLPGLRVGWVISHQDNILKLVSQLSDECVCVNPIAQELAAQAIELGNNKLIDKVICGKRLVETILATHDTIKINNPDGGTQIYGKFPVTNIDDFADYMLLKNKLVLATSSNYVMGDHQSIRIPLGCEPEKITRCLDLLASGLNVYLENQR